MSFAPRTPLSAERLDVAALDRWMRGHVPGYSGPAAVEKFPSGQSNPTYRIDAASGRYVMRRKPFGPLLPSAHAVEREYQLLAALHPTGFPVPKPYALCTDSTVIGADFYVMEMIEGRTLWDGALPQSSAAQRRATYEAMIDVLARLHGIDPSTVGLGDYGRPGNYFERQVRRWTQQYRASETERIDEAERLIAWLPLTLPVQDQVAIVHGDYRIDNMIFAADSPRVLAVLDWELSTTGDPLADFSYLLMNWQSPHEGAAGIAGLDLEALGIPTLDEAVSRYCAATGRRGVPDLNWYFAYNLFRLMAIVQGICKRVLQGTASNAQAAAMAARVRPLAAQAWACARQAGAC
jgi:aminoglycoside phosphotransferase (APT) family kinase protein